MNAADIAWVLTAFALVSLMFPGLSFLYGGMLGRKNVLNMFMMVMSSLIVTVLVYATYGHGLVLGNSLGGLGIIGDPSEYFGFRQLMQDDGVGTTLFAAFYVLFAAISLALAASGAAGRMRFGAWLIFGALWLTFVYSPLAHWVFALSDPESGYVGGWMRDALDFHDFAGGTAVHMNAGASGLAIALVLGRRKSGISRPHNLPLVLVGIGLLIAGWFGFNGGTAGGANFLATYVVLTSLLAAAMGGFGFVVVEWLLEKRPTFLGFGTGVIAGLVAITPAADAVSPFGSMAVGFLGALAAAWAISWKKAHKIDDSLDVFAVHGIAGIAGALFVMLFGNPDAPAGVRGVFLGGELSMLWREPAAIVVTLVFAFGMTWLILKIMSLFMKLRIDDEGESVGIDLSEHAESAYDSRDFGSRALAPMNE